MKYLCICVIDESLALAGDSFQMNCTSFSPLGRIARNSCGSDAGGEAHDTINPMEVIKIKLKQTELRQKHNVTFSDIKFKLRSNAVKEYKKDENEYLQSLGYERVYETNIIELIAYDKEVENYMRNNRLLTNEFKKEHLNYAIDKAQDRNEAFFNKPVKGKNNKKLVELLGGKEKKRVVEETEYDKVFGTDLLEYDSITQLKFSNLYAKEFGESLRLLQEFQVVDN
ncbi:hypothetical protein BWGOE13_55250 [Bacillus mycoides]|uniref:Uncharacterized protein n=1 Tax=Bacillus mycoides TaxID=1405 RepID=A0A1E8BL43_BACMY|nr:hypothetical protein [Bacillus mycoides]OFD90558.1 hypothetical protein BWGOE11_34220 [Bacillus mycoides]OFD91325.1 hypothetical protein BWGOE13_55250 [Bacillus mycoides]